MLAIQLTTIISQAPLRTLDDVSRDVWKAHLNGLLSDTEAQELAEAIRHRRQSQRTGGPTEPLRAAGEEVVGTLPGTVSGGSGTAPAKQPRAWSYFPAKRPQRSPDAARSLERRRTLAATGPLPPTLACRFTTGELAVLKVVADEVASKGACVLSIPEIAARAGVGPTKARMALRIAAGLGLVVSSERRVPYKPNLTNVVRIVSGEWLAWLAKRKPRSPGTPRNPPGQTDKDLQSCGGPLLVGREGSLLRRPRSQGFTMRR